MLARAASGNAAPTWFVITLWVITVLLIAGSLTAFYGAWSRRGESPTEGRRAQASCLAVFAVPTLLVGLFFLSWAVGIS
ncbi:hypothetical protein [Calidifontibacter terrae]